MDERTTREPGAGLPPADDRYLEDYRPGAVVPLGSFTITEEEIVAFATTYDPQPMHVDPSTPGGLIASGWHTASLAMRLIVDHYLSRVAGLPSPGVTSIAWTLPVRPGHRVDLDAEVVATRVSTTKPDRGVLTTRFVARSDGEVVMEFEAVSLVRRRVAP